MASKRNRTFVLMNSGNIPRSNHEKLVDDSLHSFIYKQTSKRDFQNYSLLGDK